MDRYATPKQVALIDRLAAERDPASCSDEFKQRVGDIVNRKAHGLSIREASGIIQSLFTLPKRAGLTAPAAPGYYVKDNHVFVVVENKAGTSTYAKELVIYKTANNSKRGKWAYRPGVGMDIAAMGLVPLTLDEAIRLGHLHTVCMVCGHGLTDPKSAKAGIGPVCKKRLSA